MRHLAAVAVTAATYPARSSRAGRTTSGERNARRGCRHWDPTAAAPFTPDAFTDTGDGRGITWGLCHFNNAGTREKRYSIIARFDCDLSLDVHDPAMKRTGVWHRPEVYFRQGLSPAQRRRLRSAVRERAPGMASF